MMGCDIYLFAEKCVGKIWQAVPEPQVDQRSGQIIPVEAIEIGRPYGLFSLLSGNAVGLQSELVKLPPIFTPRGFPHDMNPIYQETLQLWYTSSWGNWGVSWVRLQELVDLDWDQRLRHYAYVEEQYVDYFHPDRMFPDAFPKGGKLCHDVYRAAPPGTRKVEWSISLREYVGCSAQFIEELTTLASGEVLRIIYWFNS